MINNKKSNQPRLASVIQSRPDGVVQRGSTPMTGVISIDLTIPDEEGCCRFWYNSFG